MSGPAARPVVRQDGPDVLLRVKAVPGASRDRIDGLMGDRLKVRVAAPPQDGRANKALCALVAGALSIRPTRVTVEAGATGAEKTLRIHGIDEPTVRQAIASCTSVSPRRATEGHGADTEADAR